MVYLLGINHRLQWDREHSNTASLKKYIEETVRKFNIEALAEEYSQDIFLNDRFYLLQGIKTTTIYDIAASLELIHMYCDPYFPKRAELGIRLPHIIKNAANIDLSKLEKDYSEEEYARYKKERKKDDDIREKYWLEQIQSIKDKRIMFICGIQHVKTFRDKLLNKSFNVTLLEEIFDADD